MLMTLAAAVPLLVLMVCFNHKLLWIFLREKWHINVTSTVSHVLRDNLMMANKEQIMFKKQFTIKSNSNHLKC